MKIFGWMHRKFHNNVDYCMVSRKKDFDSFPEEGKELSILTCERGTEALVAPLIDWQDGILAIGTFGTLDHFQFEEEYSVPELEYSVAGEGKVEGAGEEPHLSVVKALVEKLEEAFGSNNEAGIMTEEVLKSTCGVGAPAVVNSPDRLLVSTEELNGEDWESREKKKKKGERTTLADLFSADAGMAAAEKCNSGEIKIQMDSVKKKAVVRTKHVRSLAKKLVPWKGEDSRPTAKLHRLLTKMLKRKIHPELGHENHGGICSKGTSKIEPAHGEPLLELELIGSNGAISVL